LHGEVGRGERERIQPEERPGERIEEVAEEERADGPAGRLPPHGHVDREDEDDIGDDREPWDGREDGRLEQHRDRRGTREGDGGPRGWPPGGVGAAGSGSAGATGPRVTRTSSSCSNSTRGATSADWKSP